MKKSFLASIITILLVAFIFFFGLGSIPSDENATVNNKNFSIKAKRKNIFSSVVATGIIKPQVGAEVKVGAQVSGIVKKLHVEIGSQVKKGEILAEIDSAPYLAKIRQAEAQKDLAETEKKYSGTEMSRIRQLLAKGYASEKDLETIQKQFDIAEANIRKADADIEYARLQLNYSYIKSPINGVVASVSTQEGETVAASFTSPTFVTIINLSELEVWAYVDETDIGRIRSGQKVKFSVDTFPNSDLEGIVHTIYPKAEIQNNVVNYITVIKINKMSKINLRPEMTANVNIFIENREDVLTLPKKFIKRENGKKYVLVLEGGVIKKKIVEVGLSDNKNYEIIFGLDGSENILLRKQKEI